MFRKKKVNIKKLGTSFDRLLNYNLLENADVDDQMLMLADAILSNCPVCINFDGVEDVNKCNHVLSFLSGLIYAINGESYQIGKESYLIATAAAFEDGSLYKHIKDVGHLEDD